MGRVARYKKVRSIDPFAKNNTWSSDQGDRTTLRRVKRKSKTALRLKEQKLRQRKGKHGAGSNGWGHDDGYDLPPEGGDEFDMKDLMGSVKKQTGNAKAMDALMEPQVLSSCMPTVTPSGHHQVQQQRKKSKANDSSNNKAAAAKKGGKQQQKHPATTTTPDGDLVITHKTPTREIIAAHSNPKRKRSNAATTTSTADGEAGPTKQERRKAYLQEKKKKKKGGTNIMNNNNYNSDDDDDNVLATHRLQQHQSDTTTSSSSTTKQPKKHISQQQNYSDTIVARSIMDDQVERPPTFSVLPRGAHKLSKNQKTKKNQMDGSSSSGDVDKEQRIRKEQQALEAMREKVMRQYSIMREKRRSGGV
mmetsp:Transcript_27430/g.40225  ORF Transcript_27430/g.40225 Transcript_27430/m.40225 type:complete len:361 (-) Transcript_27430:903-1985(-)